MNNLDIRNLAQLLYETAEALKHAADYMLEVENELEQQTTHATRWENIADGLANTHPQHDWQDSRIAYQIAKGTYRNP